MAEEFNSFLAKAKKSPIEDKVNAFGDIIEKIMSIVLRIPDLVDNSLNGINQKIASLESRVSSMNSQYAGGMSGAPTGAGMPPPPPGTPPGGPPPPPGGPPGGPPPPPGGPRPGPSAPASPVSLRGAIMGELKQLFAKRKR